ncbi:hypothetical protein M407DRAFT_20141 [Tulasnella calospora MUT 4182]|uniref:MYND-type domain-containing protein n=1 Tax=Tulasnella calospora MUT 4182 TaxID=1051891 RepID=A0A0C3QS96_9AGAM|nr:hypothetical protein M407DRAFT_20141 [Tulasnella calospora MUT 4182]
MSTSNIPLPRSSTPPPTVIEYNKVKFSAPRQEILDFLIHVHVFLPPKPSMSDETLLQMLIDTIDFMQEIGKLLRFTSLSPIIKRSDLWARSRKNAHKAWKKLWRVTRWDREHHLNVPDPIHTPFTWLRMLVTELAVCWIDGHPFMRFTNPDCSTLLVIKIRKVYSVDDDTSLFSVYYRLFKPGEGFKENRDHEWPKQHTGFFGPFKGFGFAFEMFLTQLLTNAERVPEKWRKDAPPGYRTSFVLPPGRLSPLDARHFSNNDGCPICAREASVICTECRVAWYCTEEHREEHWEEHEECCNTVRNAEWVRLVFDMLDYTELTSIGIPHGIPAPANIRGKIPFRVTVRYAWDEVEIWDVEEPARFGVISKFVHQHSSQENAWRLVANSAHSGEQCCMDFWARRTGEWTIDIAANRPLELAEDRVYVPTLLDRFSTWLYSVTSGEKLEL